jgi:hypothetical protein
MNSMQNALKRIAVGTALVSLLATTSGCGALPTSPAAQDLGVQKTAVSSFSLGDNMDPIVEDGGTGNSAIGDVSTGLGTTTTTTTSTSTDSGGKSKKPKKHLNKHL